MDKTLFELLPVSVKPEKDGWYWVQNESNNQFFRNSAKYEDGAWWDYLDLDDGEGLLQVYNITHYLRPLPPPVAEERTEVILCAAIWYKEIPLVNAEVLEGRGFKPYNTDTGAVVCGWRHANCILLKSALTGLKDSECGEHEQGFLTDKNRFVSREEAAKIALVSGQITKEIKTLFSEDLY